MFARKLPWSIAIQRTMGPLAVIFSPVLFELHLAIHQVPEHMHAQTLVPQLPIEALAMSVLLWLAVLNVAQLHLPPISPPQ